ncbi:MAG: hypothetical protein Q7S36_00320 [Candidatus Liptonbacteria bacterium]|nr:hypothetical protein [Candidatus Liptonbacteria bacterium]
MSAIFTREGKMCQAYDGEWASITASENFAVIKGFAAARKGLPKSANPHAKFGKYDREAWDHGWDCFHERILPWALERHYHLQGRIPDAQKARKQFELTGKVPAELERFLRG